MDAFIELLASYGYWGMLVSAFLAGSVFPFSSETVMVLLLGSVFNYFVGRMGKLEWIEKYLKIKKKSLDRAQRFMAGRGAWMGIFAFLPILGSAVTVVLGLTRANMFISFLSIAIGKFLRYWLLIYGVNWML